MQRHNTHWEIAMSVVIVSKRIKKKPSNGIAKPQNKETMSHRLRWEGTTTIRKSIFMIGRRPMKMRLKQKNGTLKRQNREVLAVNSVLERDIYMGLISWEMAVMERKR